MTNYIGKAALTLIRGESGGLLYCHAGEPVPDGADPKDVQRLVDEDFLVAADGTAFAGGSDGEDGPPAKSAAKPDWVAYAVSQGADEDEADASTKDELVAQYGA